jgi:phospholipase C
MKLSLGPRTLLALSLAATLAAPVACGATESGTDLGGTPTPGADGGGKSPDGAVKPGTDGSTPTPDGSTPTGGIKTVFIIMMENHSWSTIKSSGSASYINGTLVPMGAHAENYSTPTGNHPSEPNYIWLEAGDNLGIKDDNPPSANHKSTKDHLTAQLDTKGVTWKAYAEGVKVDTCPVTASGSYDPKHTPQLFFDDVVGPSATGTQYCKDHVKPYTELATDLGAGTVARYNFITPNLCNDMHGELSASCNAVTSDMIKKGDDWLKAQVPVILNSAAFKDNGVLFLLWDEGDEPIAQTASDGPIGMIAVSPLAKTNFSTSTVFTHSSLLRTVQTIFGVPYLGGAKTSNDLSEMFKAFP